MKLVFKILYVPYVKLWFWQEFEPKFVVEDTIDRLYDQVEKDDDEEVEDDESVHLHAYNCISP